MKKLHQLIIAIALVGFSSSTLFTQKLCAAPTPQTEIDKYLELIRAKIKMFGQELAAINEQKGSDRTVHKMIQRADKLLGEAEKESTTIVDAAHATANILAEAKNIITTLNKYDPHNKSSRR